MRNESDDSICYEFSKLCHLDCILLFTQLLVYINIWLSAACPVSSIETRENVFSMAKHPAAALVLK
jgi:hypothetical protein